MGFKIDLKLGSGDLIFKLLLENVFLKNHVKSIGFSRYSHPFYNAMGMVVGLLIFFLGSFDAHLLASIGTQFDNGSTQNFGRVIISY